MTKNHVLLKRNSSKVETKSNNGMIHVQKENKSTCINYQNILKLARVAIHQILMLLHEMQYKLSSFG